MIDKEKLRPEVKYLGIELGHRAIRESAESVVKQERDRLKNDPEAKYQYWDNNNKPTEMDLGKLSDEDWATVLEIAIMVRRVDRRPQGQQV